MEHTHPLAATLPPKRVRFLSGEINISIESENTGTSAAGAPATRSSRKAKTAKSAKLGGAKKVFAYHKLQRAFFSFLELVRLSQAFRLCR